MHRPGLRFSLILVLAAAAAGAGVVSWTMDRQTRARSAREQEASARVDRLVHLIASFDSAQQGYNSLQESEGAWFARVHRLLTELGTESSALRSTTSPDAAAAADTFAGVLDRVVSAVARAEENLRAGHTLMAADLVQDEGKPGAEAMRASVLQWRAAEALAAERDRTALLQKAWMAIGGATGLWAVGLLLLAAPRRATAADTASLPLTSQPADAPDLSLEPPCAPVRSPEHVEVSLQAHLEPRAHGREPLQASPVDFEGIASLCADIGRVADQNALNAVVARAAAALNASGIVIWMKREPAELVPAMTHGYRPDVVGLMGSLPLDASNLTTAAWHTGRTQWVAGGAGVAGAVAAPLFNGPTCTGVFAAELRDHGEASAAVRAAAAILAAQFGGVLAPPAPSAARDEPTAEGLQATGSGV